MPAGAPFTPAPQQQQAAVAAAAAAAYLSSAANNGPPPNAPFMAAPAAPPQPPVNLGVNQFINPNGIPGVPNYPAPMPAVTVPISVPLVHHDSGPPPGAGQGFVPGPPNPLFDAAAAAAALGGMPGGAEVRGGVTYFNPSVQMQSNPVAGMMAAHAAIQQQQLPVATQHVQKRPKAAIPIVDPNNGVGGPDMAAAAGAGLAKQGSTEDSDNSSSSKNSSSVNAVKSGT